jgi:hypothetical protein
MNKIIPIPKKMFIGVLASAFVVGTALPNFLNAEQTPVAQPHKIVLHPRGQKKASSPQVEALVSQFINLIPGSRLHN